MIFMKSDNQLSCFSLGVNPLKQKLLAEYLLPGSCLDIGCGNGLYGEKILERCSTLLQIDIVDRRLPPAQKYPFRAMDANNIDLISGTFNNIVAFDLLEHLKNDLTFVKGLSNLLQKQGRLIISVPNKDDEQPRIIGLTHIHFSDKTHRREYTKETLCKLLEGNGYKILQIRPHFNQGILNFGRALARRNYMAKLAAKWLYYQTLFFLAAGLFENRCIADWFCVAQKAGNN